MTRYFALFAFLSCLQSRPVPEQAQQNPGDPTAAAPASGQHTTDVRPFRLSDSVLVIQDTLSTSNLTAVKLGGQLLVVDNFLHRTSMSSALRVLESSFPGVPITHAISSHGHDDQTWGNELLPGGVVSIGHANTVRYMRERIAQMETFVRRAPLIAAALEDSARLSLPDSTRGRLRTRAATIRRNLSLHGDVRITPPAVAISQDTVISIGGADVVILTFGPAHTDGDVAVLVPSRRLLVVGDLAQPQTVLGIDPVVGSARAWIAALDRLIALAEQHGVEHVVGGNREAGSRATLVEARTYFTDLVTAVAEARALGLGLDEGIARIRLGRYSGWNNYAEVHDANVRAAWNR